MALHDRGMVDMGWVGFATGGSRRGGMGRVATEESGSMRSGSGLDWEPGTIWNVKAWQNLPCPFHAPKIQLNRGMFSPLNSVNGAISEANKTDYNLNTLTINLTPITMKLQYLSISQNKLTGRIPSFIGNLSSLIVLGVGYNNLEGEIPQEICRLKSLKWLSTGINKLTGTFPSCLYNMSSLTVLAATENQLNGTLPPNMFHTLPNLRVFEIGGNKISGPIPPSITNTSILSILEIGGHFRGQVPSLGKLQNLQILNLSPNNLAMVYARVEDGKQTWAGKLGQT
ncbi:hypothetical protein JHK87_025766 [Glycine soja]|nr:hypothetical protein JHK87_025766 [Glycine soja]